MVWADLDEAAGGFAGIRGGVDGLVLLASGHAPPLAMDWAEAVANARINRRSWYDAEVIGPEWGPG